MYWSILEVSLALIAACLPSLSSLITPTSLLSAVSSVRSVLSLRSSQGSSKGSTRHGPGPYTDLEHNSSASSRAGFAKAGVHTTQAEYDLQTFELVKQQKEAGVPAGS